MWLLLLSFLFPCAKVGQLNLNMDKRNLYESNLRIPLLVKGPRIAPGSHFDFPATNVDLSPTFLDMGGVTDLSDVSIDGRSFLSLLPHHNANAIDAKAKAKAKAVAARWRDNTFVEYYYVGIEGKCNMSPIEEEDNNFIAVRHFAAAGSKYGEFVYAEFQNGSDGNIAFDKTNTFEAYNLTADPWQLNNIYEDLSDPVKAELHQQVHTWLTCKGSYCP